ncbi:MAG: hypothetical protein WAN11_02520 [Syntrophobacteraceae bacterium]
MLSKKRLRVQIGLFLALVAAIAFNTTVNADDDFDQNFLYPPQTLAPDVSSFIGAATYNRTFRDQRDDNIQPIEKT